MAKRIREAADKIEKDAKKAAEALARGQSMAMERRAAGLPGVGPLPQGAQTPFVFATPQEKKKKELTKEEIKAREKAKEEMIDFANAMNLVTTYLEGGGALPTEVQRAGARRRFQMFEDTGQLDLAGMLNVGFEEEEGIPAFEDAKVYLADTNEAMFDFGSSASILSQSLVAAAHDTENASDIFRNALGGIVSELTTQLLAAQLGKFAGPVGGLIGGLITLKGRDLETSRTRTQNSVTRYN